MNARATSSSRTLLDFGAGFLFGLSITIALFAAMEEDVGPLSHGMLLAALVLLGLAIGLKLAARGRSHRRGAARPAGRDAGTRHTGWTVDVPAIQHAEARAAASSSTDNEKSRDEFARAAPPELKAAQRNAQTTAEGDSRRL